MKHSYLKARKRLFLFRIFEIIDQADINDRNSKRYDLFMLLTIVVSLLPLIFKNTYPIFDVIDIITTVIFALDYLLRFLTADYKLKKGWLSFILYPFTFMAIVDLLAILPSLSLIRWNMRPLKLIRLLRTFKMLRVFRVFKVLRYSRSISIILDVVERQRSALIAVGTLSIGYILLSALLIFNIEPETFDNFFEAIYWATISLTTLGYGDIYPTTTPGKVVTIFSSIVGIAIVALPSGILTAGYMEVIYQRHKKKDP